jgi:pilus assembly protein CpaC
MTMKRVVLFCALVVMVSLPISLMAQAAAEAGAMQQSAPSVQPGANVAKTMQTAAEASSQQQPQQQQIAPAQVSSTPAGQEPQPSAPLRVMVGKSLLITTTDRLRRVSVTDPAVADALVVTPTQVLVHGRSPGEVSLILWDEQERSRSFDLRVDADVTAAAQEIGRVFPEEKISVEALRNAIVLSGHVATKEDADRAGMIAGAFSKNVVNVLTFGPVGAQEVLLEVKFAEVDRTALTQAGLNIFSTGAGNVIGSTTTQQFGQSSSWNITDTIPRTPGSQFQTSQTVTDALNMFVFSPQIHLGAVIKALQEKDLLQILAEPNLIAVNGKESSFLAGGEFPYPVIQPGSGTNAVTIQFKEFGVRLKFTPLIMPNGNIHLRVAPEVSALDFANGLTISGFAIPALSTRRAETEFELQDGQSFIIAGLMDNRVTKVADKLPGLGDIPIIGNLFKSINNKKSTAELMVLVTAHRINASSQAPSGPTMPEKFLEPAKPAASGK